jgi:GTPase SAR1 family protein
MALHGDRIDAGLVELGNNLDALAPSVGSASVRVSVDRWRSDLSAVRFHLASPGNRPMILGLLGGTGTGKSTLVNRLLGETVSTVSFRRTYTNGAVAIATREEGVPKDWLALPHVFAGPDSIPVRGKAGELTVVLGEFPVLESLMLVDTPDVDGDCEEHHWEADRTFRWLDAVLFLVSPEKYQMSELLPYYRMTQRYRVPASFVMNKCEDEEVVEDYWQQLVERGWEAPPVYSLPRDDSAHEPQRGFADLKAALQTWNWPASIEEEAGVVNRCTDLLGRFRDKILAPLQSDREEVDRTVASLRALNAPSPDLDVSPLTAQLRRRMAEKSVLYLIGPRRMFERARQVSSVLNPLRWRSRLKTPSNSGGESGTESKSPDFWQMLVDQFVTVQARMDDIVRSDPATCGWVDSDPEAFGKVKIDPSEAGKIAEREIEDMRQWLKDRWDSNPRDTLVLEKLLKYVPGGKRVTKWTESAPYLLLVVCAANNALFGPIDLIIFGGYNLATWLGEKLSNEVTSRAKDANYWICKRYSDLVGNQTERYVTWLEERAPKTEELDRLERLLDEVYGELEKTA